MDKWVKKGRMRKRWRSASFVVPEKWAVGTEGVGRGSSGGEGKRRSREEGRRRRRRGGRLRRELEALPVEEALDLQMVRSAGTWGRRWRREQGKRSKRRV
ncbi:hypothetical protein SAY86_026527 [Trapa natans]|uniref:Uncharacterized protein n=1 Tax=Trapa natans TaxID=22666 RepID=A0AAN7QEM7_TRANT|nr:hypothetical protein SAY86_026527 [Trapa natans]